MPQTLSASTLSLRRERTSAEIEGGPTARTTHLKKKVSDGRNRDTCWRADGSNSYLDSVSLGRAA